MRKKIKRTPKIGYAGNVLYEAFVPQPGAFALIRINPTS
jgi:hypothetical protein